MGVVEMPIHEFLSQPQNVKVYWMKEPNGLSFYADAFAFSSNDKLEIYIEEFIGSQRKGVISKSVFADNKFSNPEKVFEFEIHLSYPNLFIHNNKKYCIPETCGLNEIALYVIEQNEWKKVKVLIENFAGVDSTILQWNNKWWLFCTEKKNKNADVALHIFYADDLFGTWKPHVKNPVKSDRTSARPGGTFFVNEGKLFRPSQDSSKTYGGRIVINEIVELTENTFEEKPVAYVEPSQLQGIYKDGLHTLSAAGNYTVIDAKRNLFTLRNLLPALRKKLR